jgi:hypothetical protein
MDDVLTRPAPPAAVHPASLIEGRGTHEPEPMVAENLPRDKTGTVHWPRPGNAWRRAGYRRG